MKGILTCLLCTLIMISCHSFSCAGEGKIREEKLRYNTLYVDMGNTIWIGCETGLYQWKNTATYRVPPTANINVTAILASGRFLLLGTDKGKLYLYDRYFKKLKIAGDMKACISDITLHDHMIAIASKGNGYIIITPYTVTHYTTAQGLTDNFVYKIFIDSRHSVWTSTDLGLNIHTNDERVTECHLNHKIPDRLITSFVTSDSMLICGTQQGDICKIDLRDSSVLVFDHTIWHSAQINDLRILDHSIAVATDHGAYLLDMDGRLIETINRNKPIKKIGIDKEATVWFCGDRLLVSSIGEQIAMIKDVGNMPISNVHSILTDHQKAMFLTPDQGLIKFDFRTKSVRKINITDPKDLIDITSIYLDRYGRIWVGTYGRGLYQIDTSTMTYRKIDIDSSVETSAILTITGDEKNLWVSSLNGVWYSNILNGQYQFKSLEDQYNKKKYYVYDVKKDSKQNLWLATDGQGILKITGSKVTDMTVQHKLRPNVFYTIEEDLAGGMWFNAYNDGLYCLKADSMFHLSQDNGLSSNDILSIHLFQKKYLIAVSTVGIDLIETSTFTVTSLNFESLRFAPIPETNSISTDQTGSIFIGTDAGIIKFYLPTYKTQFKPVSRIDDVLVMGKPILRETNRFDYEENYFKFIISANCNTEQGTYFRYRLKGLTEQWNQTVDKEAVFPRLNPGEYEFVLQSANNRRFQNASEDHYSFTILNPFWKQNWFIFLALCLLTLAIYYYILFRESRISKVQQLEKEKAIAEFETLKHQVSPHFLFNSFNTLIQVIDEDKEKAIEYTQMLSDYYRSLLSYNKVNLVSLEEEFILLEKYIYLQKMGFGESLCLDNTCTDEQIKGVEIPPLTLQLLAENAIKHNVVSTTKPLTILIRIEAGFLIVSNKLNEKNGKEAGEHIGLQNIKNRFRLFSKQGVEIHKSLDIFEVRLPLLTYQNE